MEKRERKGRSDRSGFSTNRLFVFAMVDGQSAGRFKVRSSLQKTGEAGHRPSEDARPHDESSASIRMDMWACGLHSEARHRQIWIFPGRGL